MSYTLLRPVAEPYNIFKIGESRMQPHSLEGLDQDL
jgi:hypothetical protein